MSACECAACGIVTTGLGAFDKHQDVDYSRRPAVVCLDPAEVGLVQNERGRWGFPLDASGREYFASLAASRAQAGTSGVPQGTRVVSGAYRAARPRTHRREERACLSR